MSLFEPSKEEIFAKCLQSNVRLDDRKCNEMRELQISTGVIRNAHGSARVSLGKTTIICGVKGELTKPKPEEPNMGFIVPNVELPALCSSLYKSGAPSDQAQTITMFINNLIKKSNIVDRTQLSISSDQLAWVLYCDMVCINCDGNLHEACVAALTSALSDVKLPKVTMDSETENISTDSDEQVALKLNNHPVCATYAVYEKYILRDPTRSEEEMAPLHIVYVVDEHDNIVFHQQTGGISDEKMSCCRKNACLHASNVRKQFYGDALVN